MANRLYLELNTETQAKQHSYLPRGLGYFEGSTNLLHHHPMFFLLVVCFSFFCFLSSLIPIQVRITGCTQIGQLPSHGEQCIRSQASKISRDAAHMGLCNPRPTLFCQRSWPDLIFTHSHTLDFLLCICKFRQISDEFHF